MVEAYELEALLGTDDASVLIGGQPGVGKTALLRSIAYYMGENIDKTFVVDKGEISGIDIIAHPVIGEARRALVKENSGQESTITKLVENHSPRVLIADETNSKEELLALAKAATNLSHLIATTHTNSLEQLLKNHDYAPVLGGVDSMPMTDALALKLAKKNKTELRKTRLEKKEKPKFKSLIIMRKDFEIGRHILVYPDLDTAIDNELLGIEPYHIKKWVDKDGRLQQKTFGNP